MHLLPNLRELQALKPERGWEVSGWAAGGGVRAPQRQPSLAGLFPASPLSPPPASLPSPGQVGRRGSGSSSLVSLSLSLILFPLVSPPSLIPQPQPPPPPSLSLILFFLFLSV